ncbi:unnamed protein product [Eruca vesicaria subsp. sativa]|uniref:Tify domain-containing protein n=1 Tax=Eruca vesicaria subsp. sativa TaxID=29727 RepID=A0ABC8ISB6_ERUVS|nr:unnamed protein product [Eruca vesicaria subsp. sativa]
MLQESRMRTDLVREEDVEENLSSVSTRMELKRIHQWLTQEESSGSELFSNKRQVVEIDSSAKPGFLTPHMSTWDNSLVPRQLSSCLFDPANPQHTYQEVVHGSSSFNLDTIRNVKVNQVCESPESMVQFYGEGGVSRSFEMAPSYEDNTLSFGQTCSNIDKSFILPGPVTSKPDGNFIPNLSYDKGDENVFSTFALMGQSLQKADENFMSLLPCDKASENLFMTESSYHKKNANVVLPGGKSPLGSPVPVVNSFENFSYSPAEDNMFCQSRNPPYASSRVDTLIVPKSKDSKTAKKGSTNTFPSNVKSLLSTGMFDGVTVKYYSWSREKNLKGVIKGTGYLCGCSSCNLTKVLNAYEFEQHANCKTKHPNNHIYFENGKTIYGVVQELKNTPQEKLFDAIQNVTGSDINYKNFNTWKASYQVASLELQRIYGKDVVTLGS